MSFLDTLFERYLSTENLKGLDGDKVTIEIFIEPSSRDIHDILSYQDNSSNGIRLGYTYDTGTLYAWDGSVGHKEVMDSLDKSFIRMTYINNIVTVTESDYTLILPRLSGGVDQLIRKLLLAFPGLQKIVSENNTILWEK